MKREKKNKKEGEEQELKKECLESRQLSTGCLEGKVTACFIGMQETFKCRRSKNR